MIEYSLPVWEHFLKPRHGGWSGEDSRRQPAQSLQGRAGSSDEGALIELRLELDRSAEPPRIRAARFKAYGCPATIACASWVADWLQARALDEAAALGNAEIITALALPALKVRCAVIAERALADALAAYDPEPEDENTR